MARLNVKTKNRVPEAFTHEGAPARLEDAKIELRRAIMACMLWEDQFYESGEEIATRIVKLAEGLDPNYVADLAIEARESGLRHAPLLLLNVLAKTGAGIPHLVADTIVDVVNRPDELAELLAIYWRNGKKPLPAQFKKGLARAFNKFDAYQLAKYNRDNAVKLRDVAFLTHVKPLDKNAEVVARLVNKDRFPESVKRAYGLGDFKKLDAPDTWEVNLSAGADKKATFTRMLTEGKLGYLAVLRNLRNMVDAGVERKLIRDAIMARKGARGVFPFRYFAAAKAAPTMVDALDTAFLAQMAEVKKLPGTTVVVVDVSGSMFYGQVSAKSDMTRVMAASSLAAIMREVCEDAIIVATGTNNAIVPSHRGLALADKVADMTKVVGGGGIYLKKAMDYVYDKIGLVDRVIVITDEQDCGGYGDNPLKARRVGKTNYIINVSSYKHAITYDDWVRISGWSESIVSYIAAMEEAKLG